MKAITPRAYIQDKIDGKQILKKLEECGRVCYKSEGRVTATSAEPFVRNLIEQGHESVLEHVSITVRFIVDRGVSHEIVRHRLASYSQESTRYCNYVKESFGSQVTFIKPFFFEEGSPGYRIWEEAMKRDEQSYFDLLDAGHSPQEARSVLPNSTKTELVMTADLREWRLFFKQRCAKQAHPQMRQVSIPLLCEFKEKIPVVFNDLRY